MSEEVDEDQWLYGNGGPENASKPDDVPVAKEAPATNEEDLAERPSTPTLDDLEQGEANIGAPEPAENWVAPDLVQKQKNEASAATDDDKTADEEENEKGSEDSSSDEDDDDDVQIHIGEIKTTPAGGTASGTYSRAYRGSLGSTSGAPLKKVEMDGVGDVNGVPLFEYDVDAHEKPWKLPGADITDYFNYGFGEETWKLYCERQRQMKSEVGQLNKTVIASTGAIPSMGTPTAMMPTITQPIGIGLPPPPIPAPANSTDMGNNVPLIWYKDKPGDQTKKVTTPTFVPPTILPPPPIIPPPPPAVPTTPVETDVAKDEKEQSKSPRPASDGKATPELDSMEAIKPIKGPLLPPPTAPPPPFPGVPPPGMMHAPGLPPPIPGLHPGLPPHGLPMPDGFPPPPFPPQGLPPRGPDAFHHPFDERGLPAHPEFLGLFPPAWDPSIGPPPPEFFDTLRPSTPVRVSRSRSRTRSRSRSYSSDSISDYDHKKRHKRDRNRRRSRSRSRDRHRSSRHHRHDHRRDRDRDRDRRDRRSERSSRHESSRHHRRSRSYSRDRDEERSSSSRHKRESRESRETRESNRESTRESRETKETTKESQTPPP